MAGQATRNGVDGNMRFKDGDPGLARIANELADSNEHLRHANNELQRKLRLLKQTATDALKPMDIPTMNKQELALYELLKTL